MVLYENGIEFGKKTIVACSLIAILGGCETSSDCYDGNACQVQEINDHGCLTPQLSDCLKDKVNGCGSDTQCIYKGEGICGSYLPKGCHFSTFGPIL